MYHEDCWKQYEKQDRISKMLLGLGAPAIGIVFGIAGMVFTHNSGTALEIGGGAAVAMIVGGIITKPRG